MITGDMRLKRDLAMRKLREAIELHAGTTVAVSGCVDDPRFGLAAVEAGARILEPNHGERALALGYKGAKTMHDTVPIRHEIPLEEMAKAIRGLRNVVGAEIFIFVGVPGNFTELVPLMMTEEKAEMLAYAGADGLHTHKSTLKDVHDIVDLGHRMGLLVDAYIADPTDPYPFGIPARTPQDVARVAGEMEQVGVDVIGLVTNMSYSGAGAGNLDPYVEERLRAMVATVSVPTAVEGGINVSNHRAFRETGVNILIAGTSVTDAAREGVRRAVAALLTQ